MTEKEYEPIDPQDLKDFALLDVHGQPKTEKSKVVLLRDISLQKEGGFFWQSRFADPQAQQYFTASECEQLIHILASNLEDYE